MKAVLKNEQLYEGYVDSLMFIHDLICELSATQGRSRLTRNDTEVKIQQLLQEPLLRNSPSILENIQTNYQAAQKILREGEESHTAEKVFAVEERATLFLESLLQAYRILRTSRGKMTLE